MLHSSAGDYNVMLLTGPLNLSARVSRHSLTMAPGYIKGWIERILIIKAADHGLAC